MVFQSYALFPHMSVRDNVGYGLKMSGVARAEARARTDQALELVGLTGYGERLPAELSGGQQQRVAIARAVVLEPEVLLLDEPLSNLDAKLRRSVRDEIRHLQQRLAVTTVYVTHDQEEAMGVADRMIVMRSGQIAQEGTPIELYDHPNSSFMADFIGDANLLGCDARRSQDGSWIATVQGEEIKVLQASIEPGPAKLVIRPDAITIAASPSHHGGLPGEVESCSFLGDRRLYKIRTAIGLLYHVEYHPQMSWAGLRSIEIKLNPARLKLVPG
ncbi:ABC transporter ATP-binding protein [Labrys neptuniae]